MKKVLFVGHFNDQTKQIQKELSKFVSIQLCSDNVTIAESMMGIYEPDLVLVNVEGFTDGHLEFFQILAEKYVMTPVVIIGSEAAGVHETGDGQAVLHTGVGDGVASREDAPRLGHFFCAAAQDLTEDVQIHALREADKI